MLKHFSTDRAFDRVGILAVKRAYLEILPVGLIWLEDKSRSGVMHRCFARHNIVSIADLIAYSEKDLLHFRNVGPVMLSRLKAVLERYDLQLGTDIRRAEIPANEQEWYDKIYTETRERLTEMTKQTPIVLDVLLR